MRQILLPVFLPITLMLFSCGGRQESDGAGSSDTVSLYAGKGVFLTLDLLSGILDDSLLFSDNMPAELIIRSTDYDIVISVMLVPGCGSIPEDRLNYLEIGGVFNPIMTEVPPLGETPGFSAVLYQSEDFSIVERVWNRGAGELSILQAKASGTSPNVLLSSITGIFRTAELIEPSDYLMRSVYLSDRTRTEIVEEVNADITVSPGVSHRIILTVNPTQREITVIDTLIIDFASTQSDSQLTLYLPDTGSDVSFEALTGSVVFSGDSICCVADSLRRFTGLFSSRWNGFISGSTNTDRITVSGLQIKPSTSFQCGMWFYPGCEIPAEYKLDILVPDIGYEIYASLNELSRTIVDSLMMVSYSSPEGGIRGPVAWVTGRFSENGIAGWRSRYIYQDSDSLALEMSELADDLASVLWNSMDFTGARLDFVIVRSLDVPVFLTGPGCVFLSSDVLASIQGYESWSDSLAAGIQVPETFLVFEIARAFLSGSTYLSENLRDVLAAWSVYRFATMEDENTSAELLDAFRKYYLYTTEIVGGTEYAIADPRLLDSPLYDPVILGKAPIVIEFLTGEIPAFERGLPRALGNLRHSGDSFNRLFSAMGIWENSEYGELFFQWFYNPGVPQIEVTWTDSLESLFLFIEQYQPGQDFPLGSVLDDVLVITEEDSVSLELTRGSTEGFYSCRIPDTIGKILTIDIDHERILPADIIYRHRHNSMDY